MRPNGCRLSALFVLLPLVAGCSMEGGDDTGAAPDILGDRLLDVQTVHSQGLSMQGLSMQGLSMQGLSMQGLSMQGITLGATVIQDVQLIHTAFRGTVDGVIMSGKDFI